MSLLRPQWMSISHLLRWLRRPCSVLIKKDRGSEGAKLSLISTVITVTSTCQCCHLDVRMNRVPRTRRGSGRGSGRKRRKRTGGSRSWRRGSRRCPSSGASPWPWWSAPRSTWPPTSSSPCSPPSEAGSWATPPARCSQIGGESWTRHTRIVRAGCWAFQTCGESLQSIPV